MTATAAPTSSPTLSEQQLGTLFQYTIEAYKTFEKLAENLPNPMAAATFKQFALDERENRDLLELKVNAPGNRRVRVTLGGDLQFQEMIEGDLSYREMTEFMIGRERTMQRRLRELQQTASPSDRNLLVYLEATKRAHMVELERELELIKVDPDWFRREDAQWRIVHGHPTA